jgi:peptidoglycan/LPS O-acetylase OafA/YrhL
MREASSGEERANSAQRFGRLPELDGLRGIAILSVLSLHYITNSRTTNPGFGLLYHFAQAFRLGWSGVDLFFVLSGFLIGGILLDVRQASNYFSTFYLRRAHRILPIYYLWLASYAAVSLSLAWGPIHSSHSSAVPAGFQVLIHLLFLQNLVPTATAHPIIAHYWISVAWSLAVEEQFYLIAPLMVRYLSTKRIAHVLIACIVGAPILRAILYSRLPGGNDLIYVLMPCRADSLAAGMLAALACRSDARFWLERHTASLRRTLGILVFGALVMLKWLPGARARSSWQAAFQFSWLAALYVCLLLLALLERNGGIARISRWKFLREWGRVSYCIYLLHLGVLGLCHWVLLRSLPSITNWAGVLTTLLAVGLTWSLAQLSWTFFEKPLLNRGHHYHYSGISGAPCKVPALIIANA